jgi:hypothetical protein
MGKVSIYLFSHLYYGRATTAEAYGDCWIAFDNHDFNIAHSAL